MHCRGNSNSSVAALSLIDDTSHLNGVLESSGKFRKKALLNPMFNETSGLRKGMHRITQT